MAGRLILLKSSLDSLPLYWFNLYIIPPGILSILEKMRRQFIWGENLSGNTTSRKIHLLSWDKLCSGKEIGGLGIVPLKSKNLALLAKWWWRVYSERPRLWNRILAQRYGNDHRIDISSLSSRNDTSLIV